MDSRFLRVVSGFEAIATLAIFFHKLYPMVAEPPKQLAPLGARVFPPKSGLWAATHRRERLRGLNLGEIHALTAFWRAWWLIFTSGDELSWTVVRKTSNWLTCNRRECRTATIWSPKFLILCIESTTWETARRCFQEEWASRQKIAS